MRSNKFKIGNYIEPFDERNYNNTYNEDSVRGIATSKVFIPTKADLDGVSLTSYKIVKPKMFAYVSDTSRRGDKISLAYNDSEESYLVSSISTIFKIKDEKLSEIIPEFLYLFFNRPEFDRYSRFNSWGSARETFSWDDLCETEIKLPSIDVQQKYVDIFMGLKENIEVYEKNINELGNFCAIYLEKLKKSVSKQLIGKYIIDIDERNINNEIKLAQGVTVDLVFTEPKRIADDTESAKIVRTGQFAYNKVMKAGGTKLPIALRAGADCTVSNSYQVFEVINTKELLPEYLMMWMSRSETQRYAGFISFGTTRDIYSFDNLCETKIPLPDIEIQKNIVNIFNIYVSRKRELDRLKDLQKNICPILIKGVTEEVKKCEVVEVG